MGENGRDGLESGAWDAWTALPGGALREGRSS